MPEAWRIVKTKHGATAFTGEGAAITGGRWNSRGVPVVYASATQALVVLENLVHLNPMVLFSYVVFHCDFKDTLVQEVDRTDLPADWMLQPPSTSTQAMGDAWVAARKSAILAVPSVIVPGERNYLFNPAHADFGKIRIGKAQPFSFDARLMK